jgi:CDP-glycerol glycerophosphotransferase (TagB/SpsB family)
VCIDAEKGWNRPRKFSLPLSEIGDWPTHTRFRSARAGKVVGDRPALKQAIQEYLANPQLDREARLAFVKREVTYTDGRAAERTAEFIVSLT